MIMADGTRSRYCKASWKEKEICTYVKKKSSVQCYERKLSTTKKIRFSKNNQAYKTNLDLLLRKSISQNRVKLGPS